jgi:hypothetical protein
MGHEHTKQYLYDKWSDHYQSGMPPMVLKNIAAYPVLEKNGVTLYTAPNNITERILSYGIGEFEFEKEFGVTYFFLNKDGQAVDNFEGDKRFCSPMVVTLDQFTDHHGCHFDELEIENKQTCFYL